MVFGRGSQVFDFRSTTRSFDASTHEGGAAQATPRFRSGVWRESSHAFDYWSTAHNLEAGLQEGDLARATPWCLPQWYSGAKEVTFLTF